MKRPWLRIAHRGASGSAPEHTRAAFRRAVELGVDMIELDVQLTRDEQLVVMHDLDLRRTTSGTGIVREHDLADIRGLDAGAWFGPDFVAEHPVSLNEVIELVGSRARLNVEIKAQQGDWPILATRLISLLRDHGLMRSAIVSCFEPGALVALRERSDDIQLGLLWQRPDTAEAWEWAATLRTVSIHPHWMLTSPDVVRTAHARGLAVLTWTVNDVDTMRALVLHEIDGIISDFPERFAAVVADPHLDSTDKSNKVEAV